MQGLLDLFKRNPHVLTEDIYAGSCNSRTALLEEKAANGSIASTTTLLDEKDINADATSDTTSTSWKERRQYNEQTSALYRIPDEVLLRCFGGADFLSQQMLRQTCHRFAYVITKLGGDRSKQPFDNTFGPRQVWPCHGTKDQRNTIRRQWAALVRRDVTDLCQGCRDFDTSGLLDERLRALAVRLWCSGCLRFHQRGKFSTPQRQERFFTRRCIGWTGRVRVCPHLDVSWDMVQHEKKRLVQTGWRGGVDMPFFKCPKRCLWQGNDTSYVNHPPRQPKTKGSYPEAVITTLQARKDGMLMPFWAPYRMGTAWQNPLFDVDPDPAQGLSRQLFRRALGSVNPAGGPYLCPHMRIDNAIDIERLLEPLKEPYCVCLSDDGNEAGFDMQQHACNTESSQWRCRCLRRASSEARGRPLDFDDKGNLHHTSLCDICHADFMWVHRHGTILLLRGNSFSCSSAGLREWIRQLDPHSWHMTEDSETQHVYWCPEKRCRTNHKWRAFYRRLEREDSPRDAWNDGVAMT